MKIIKLKNNEMKNENYNLKWKIKSIVFKLMIKKL